MGNFFSTITDSVKSLPKAVNKTVNKAVQTVSKAPAQASQTAKRVVRDTVQLTGKARHTEVNRRQVLQAARSKNTAAPSVQKAPAQKVRNTAAPSVQSTRTSAAPQVAAPLSKEVLREMSPAKQRAYFAHLKQKTGRNISDLNLQQKQDNGVNLYDIVAHADETSFKALGDGWDKFKKFDAKVDRAIKGTEGVYQADLVAQDLQKKKIQRFEEKLKAQSPERYAHYKKVQDKDAKQLASEANSETWKRRDLQLEEEARSRQLLAKNPGDYKLSARHLENVKRADQNIVDGNFRKHWHELDAYADQKTQEKKALPNKAAWLKSLSPEARANYLQREKQDQTSIAKSSVAREQSYDAVKDLLSLGTGKTIAEDGLGETLMEVGTLGTYNAAKVAGTDLGRYSAYAEQADSLKKSGLHLQAAETREKAGELRRSGVLNLGMAGLSAVGLGTAAHAGMMKMIKAKLPPLPGRTVTVVTKNRALPGTTTRAANSAAAETALSFDDVVGQARRSGLYEQLDVVTYDYKRVSTGRFQWKPKLEKIPTVEHINVHGAQREFAERLGKTLEELPEGAYQGVRMVDDVYVGDFAHFKNADGTITSGLQGAARPDTGSMILNQRTIDAPLRKQLHSGIHQNGKSLSKGFIRNSMMEEGFKRENAALRELADKNLRETVYHELGHFQDEFLGVTESGVYKAKKGPAYSAYAKETGSASEDLAEGFSHVLEQRRHILKTQGPDADWRAILRKEPGLGPKNDQIISEMIDNIDYDYFQAR